MCASKLSYINAMYKHVHHGKWCQSCFLTKLEKNYLKNFMACILSRWTMKKIEYVTPWIEKKGCDDMALYSMSY
jgi:hypothetical protein